MQKTILSGVLALFAAAQAGAVTITTDIDYDRVTLTGSLDWSVVADPIGPLQSSTDYVITMQLSGSPFEAGFTVPAVDTPVVLEGTTIISVENPKVGFGTQTVSGLAGAYGISSTAPTAPLPQQGVYFENMVRQFPAGSLTGDITYQLAVAFDPTFSTITSVIAGLRVRTPVNSPSVGSDIYTTELYLGIDDVSAELPTGETPPKEEPTPSAVPVPAAGLLFLSAIGIGGLGAARRRRAG